MSAEKCCGNCMYHLFDEDQDDWECRNVLADAYLNWTGYDDCCEDFVPREPKKKKLSDRMASELDRRDRAFHKYKREL